MLYLMYYVIEGISAVDLESRSCMGNAICMIYIYYNRYFVAHLWWCCLPGRKLFDAPTPTPTPTVTVQLLQEALKNYIHCK